MGKGKSEMTKNDKNLEELQSLIQGSWSGKQLLFIQYLTGGDVAKTQNEFAKEIKVDIQTLSRWKRNPLFLEDVKRVAECRFLELDLQVMEQIAEDALLELEKVDSKIAGAVIRNRELYMKLRGKLVEKLEHTGKGGEPIVFRWKEKEEEDNGD